MAVSGELPRTTVLVAEDEPVSRRRLELQLERRGFDVRCAADGERYGLARRQRPGGDATSTATGTSCRR
jgi:CheY-like chemotaxis protein